MKHEYGTGQGEIVPKLFIGLGGTGSRIVDRIAARAFLMPNWKSRLQPLTHFVSIDTNELDQHKLRAIPSGNRINIAAFDKSKVIQHFRRSEDRQALQWLDKGYQPRPGFTPGAGQIRVESRLGFYYRSVEIRQRIQQLVAESLGENITWRQDVTPKFYVYLFSTLAGGTGSGSFLPMAYLVHEVIEEQRWQPRIIGNLLLSSLLLDVVGPELHPDIHANTYAALKELEHLTKLDYSEVKKEGRTSEPFVYRRDETRREVMEVHSRPFFLTFIHDRPPHLSLRDPQSAIADAAFLQLFTPLIDNLAGELDNYEKHLEGLTRFPGRLRDVGHGYAKNYGVFGAAALVLPGLDLLEYCAHRFAAQALRAQITFGVDREAPDDDRARALARLAVDYADPKFLAMSDEGRDEVIHGAFVSSVREMARQDEREDLQDGFWTRLVDRVDAGAHLGTDKDGELQRGESLLERTRRLFKEDRDEQLNRMPPIKEKAFVFHREGVNQYAELVSRLENEIQTARGSLDESARSLELSASEGEVVTDPKLDPIAERYFVLRLLTECSKDWIPAARQGREKAAAQDISNPKVRERLKVELFESLREAAGERKLFRRGDQAFLDARDEAQDYYRKVVEAAKRFHGADLELRQLRRLEDYLKARARQYARLAGHMDTLVRELEADAERLRRGEIVIDQPPALRVEVLETLDEPRRRLWDGVYRELYVKGARYMTTFDRQVLAEVISKELRPEIRADGKVVQKSVDQTVDDLRGAMVGLGRERLRPGIFGDETQLGLSLEKGLELEAQLVLEGQGRRWGKAEVARYVDQKIRALAQLAGVLARVDTADTRALDDGVVSNQRRQLIVRGGENGNKSPFAEHLCAQLSIGGSEVQSSDWHDPQLAVVHDVVLPIPLYYIHTVVSDIEESYLRLAADEKRPYHLHTDFNWEKTLPNLNPKRSEISVDWSLRMLAEGLITRVVRVDDREHWWWYPTPTEAEPMGDRISAALFQLSEVHRVEELRSCFQDRVDAERSAAGAELLERRRLKLIKNLRDQIVHLRLEERRGKQTRADRLSPPMLAALADVLEQRTSPEAPAPATETDGSTFSVFGVD